jgi:hypothetical protein
MRREEHGGGDAILQRFDDQGSRALRPDRRRGGSTRGRCNSPAQPAQQLIEKHGLLLVGRLCGLRYDEKNIVPGAQTKRQGGAGPVRSLLGRKGLTGHILLIEEVLNLKRSILLPGLYS